MEKNVIKNKRKRISMEEKYTILDKLGRGERLFAIAKELNLNESTIRTIKRNESKIRQWVSIGSPNSVNKVFRITNTLLSKMEKCLQIWIEDCNEKDIPLSVRIIKHKALKIYVYLKQETYDLNSAFENHSEFKASNGWFDGFINRFSLRSIKMNGERASADDEAAERFKEKFKKIMEDESYTPDQVFNADETGLNWKKMPERTFISKTAKSAPGFKVAKDRITVLLCSNASGSCMTKPMVVSHYLNPRAFKGIDKSNLPVYWRANKKAWITGILFRHWFFNCFVPEMEKFTFMKNIAFKILLLIDNAPGHSTDLYHPNVKVMFSPPNTTSIIQPLDQGIIKTFKSYYIRRTF